MENNAEVETLSDLILLESDSEGEGEESETVNNSDQPPSNKDWLCYAGRLTSAAKKAEVLLNSLKKCDDIDWSQFLLNVSSATSAILNIRAKITEMAVTSQKSYGAQEQLSLQGSNLDLSPSPVDDDPGKRLAAFTENEKPYLIKVGPQQPKLTPFLRNEKIYSTKQCRLSSDWYFFYPYFEYSIKIKRNVSHANCFCPRLKEKRVRVLG